MVQGSIGGARKQIDRFDNKVLHEHISCFLINTNASLSVVENSSFQQVLQYCNPSAVLISRRTASFDILTLYSKLLLRIKNMLRDYTVQHGGCISLTLDIWTLFIQIPFLGITAYYIKLIIWKF